MGPNMGPTGPSWAPCWPLHWRHNDNDSVSNHQPHGCLHNRLFGRRSKKTSKLRVTGLCAGNSPGPVNSPHKGPVTRKMFPFVIMDMAPWTLLSGLAPIQVTMVKNKCNPWMNSDIIDLMYERHFIYKEQGSKNVPCYVRSIDFSGIRWLIVSIALKKYLMKCPMNIKTIKNYAKNADESSGTRGKIMFVPQTITSNMFNEYFFNIGSDLIKSMAEIYHGKLPNVSTRFLLNQLKKTALKI